MSRGINNLVFTSPVFLFLFLPVVLGLYYLSPRNTKNTLLLIASLIFYAWGEHIYVLLMLLSISVNYKLALELENNESHKRRKKILAAGVAFNLLLLCIFKYSNFIFDNIDLLLSPLSIGLPESGDVHLPLGISFFTFQAMSYLIDVYRHEVPAQKSFRDVALYITLFPQLIAGPIVRYHDVAQQLTGREHSLSLFSSGVHRFIQGLGKKMLIANPLGEVADHIFALPATELTTPIAWLGIICYTLQIYFDFSGYSDMAIGLGRMFGFRFLENFNHPYVACSVQEFWRRWHISLSRWFRDYLYIPLGGNRKGEFKTYRNLTIVFLVTGLWHGASWNFILWGAYHGFFLIIERGRFGQLISALPIGLQHLYLLLVVMIGWVFFRSPDLVYATDYLAAMFGMSDSTFSAFHYWQISTDFWMPALVVGILLSKPWSLLNNMGNEVELGSDRLNMAPSIGLSVIKLLGLAAIFYLCLMAIAASTYNPFIYFRF